MINLACLLQYKCYIQSHYNYYIKTVIMIRLLHWNSPNYRLVTFIEALIQRHCDPRIWMHGDQNNYVPPIVINSSQRVFFLMLILYKVYTCLWRTFGHFSITNCCTWSKLCDFLSMDSHFEPPPQILKRVRSRTLDFVSFNNSYFDICFGSVSYFNTI